MNKRENNTHNKETANLSAYLRIKDRHAHFLGEIHSRLVRIYCKKCKEFFEVPINQLVGRDLKG